ncbi:MAG: hypothetical protein AB8V03_04555 [Francisella endosymbiont of Hyalomma asiaticum]
MISQASFEMSSVVKAIALSVAGISINSPPFIKIPFIAVFVVLF